MGLLEYIKANTPRATRPVASPGTVINQGLLNPNQFNAPSANRFKDSLLGLAGIIPGAGDYASGVQAADLFNRGENFAGSMAALGALPMVPSIAGIFAGKGAKTADLVKQAQAEKMLSAGNDPAKVWQETGWGKGPDGQWAFEIPDNTATYRGSKAAGSSYAEDVMNHPEFFAAYPNLKSFRVVESPAPIGGMYDHEANKIWLGNNAQNSSVMLHELSHGVQRREGFPRGGSPKEFKDFDMPTLLKRINENSDGYIRAQEAGGIDPVSGLSKDIFENNISGLKGQVDEILSLGGTPHNAYLRLGGEAEARLTQARMAMTPAERAEQYPWEPEYFEQATGVPLNSLRFKYDDGLVTGLLK